MAFDVICSHLRKSFSSAERTSTPCADLSVRFPAGCISTIIGESGCGKTTLLRIIAGLEPAEAGSVTFCDANQKRPARVAMVFQEPRLMDWLTVEENVALAVRHLPRALARERVASALQSVALDACAQAMPAELSGGMAQRVGFARALAADPDVLLLDEAFSALDALTRERLRREFVRIHAARPMTVIAVTHDVLEAVLLSSHIHKLAHGRLEQSWHVPVAYPRALDDARVADLAATLTAAFLDTAGAARDG